MDFEFSPGSRAEAFEAFVRASEFFIAVWFSLAALRAGQEISSG
jgi:hypothetical protein